jgi:hypothetical protein
MSGFFFHWILVLQLQSSGPQGKRFTHWAISLVFVKYIPHNKPSVCCLFVVRFIALFILCIWIHCHCLQTQQKRASDPITDGCEPPCGCWNLNSGPLEEQSVLLTTESSLQPQWVLFLTSFQMWTIKTKKKSGSEVQGRVRIRSSDASLSVSTTFHTHPKPRSDLQTDPKGGSCGSRQVRNLVLQKQLWPCVEAAMCMYVWERTHMHVATRDWYQVSASASAFLAGHQEILSSPPPCAGITGAQHHAGLLAWEVRIWTQVWAHICRESTPLSEPAPQNCNLGTLPRRDLTTTPRNSPHTPWKPSELPHGGCPRTGSQATAWVLRWSLEGEFSQLWSTLHLLPKARFQFRSSATCGIASPLADGPETRIEWFCSGTQAHNMPSWGLQAFLVINRADLLSARWVYTQRI